MGLPNSTGHLGLLCRQCSKWRGSRSQRHASSGCTATIRHRHRRLRSARLAQEAEGAVSRVATNYNFNIASLSAPGH
jgi:hypothetical protein